jgi:hypothetical protein
MKLFEQFGSTGYGQTLLKCAKRAISEVKREQFLPVYNIITEKGKKVLINP